MKIFRKIFHTEARGHGAVVRGIYLTFMLLKLIGIFWELKEDTGQQLCAFVSLCEFFREFWYDLPVVNGTGVFIVGALIVLT